MNRPDLRSRDLTSVLAAVVAATPSAGHAALYTATLTQVLTYSNSGTAGTAGNITSSTATWTYDDVTNLVSQTGGTFNVRFTTAPTTTLFRTSITGLVLGNGAPATATTYACTEGNFGTNVGASICGNYNFGANAVNDSTSSWGPGTSVSRTIGGDDNSIGAQQSIATLNTMTTSSFDSTPVTGTLVITNKTCTGPCATLPAGAYNNGQQWTFGNFVLVVQGPVDDAADAESGQQISIDVMANDAGYTDPVTVTIDTPPNQGGTATVTNSPGAASAIRINYTSAANFSGTETFVYRAVSGSLDDTGTVTVTVEDTVPAAISFTSQTGVALSSQVTSATANVTGISTAVPITVANGQYSVDGGAFTSAAGTVQNNQTVALRHTSAATPATDTVTTVTIGGFSTVQGTFTSTTTLETDTTPEGFAFIDQTGVPLSVPVTSAPVVVTGINVPAPISVSGGQYSVNGGAFTSSAGLVASGDSVRARHTSSPAPGTGTDTTVTVGTVSDIFTSTTLQYALDDVATTSMNQPVQINVLANDAGLASTVFVGLWIDPAHGSAVVTGAPGSPSGIRITYTPSPGYSGPDSFEYWVESGLIVDYGQVAITVTNPDVDGDGVPNVLDNCSQVANPSQCDSDGDGYGNRCDGDFTGNGFTNANDTVVMRQLIQDPSTPPTYNQGDINCNGFVNAQDVALFRQLLGKPPGPGAQAP